MKKTTFAALVISLAAGSAFATTPLNGATPPESAGHPHGGHGSHMFAETDSNKDGSISQDEWKAKGDKLFAERDTNKDGKISEDEMKAFGDAKRAKWQEHRAKKGGEIKTPADNAAPKN